VAAKAQQEQLELLKAHLKEVSFAPNLIKNMIKALKYLAIPAGAALTIAKFYKLW
jgi:hypothetical protein